MTLEERIVFIRKEIEHRTGLKIIYLGTGGSFSVIPGSLFFGWHVDYPGIAVRTENFASYVGYGECIGCIPDMHYFVKIDSDIAKLNGHHNVGLVSRKLSL